MDKFYTYLNTITPISERTWAEFQSILSPRDYKAGDIITKMGDYPKKVFFLKSGYARAYVLTHKNKEFNREIFAPSEFMSSLAALMQGVKSKMAIECLTDCEVVETLYEDYVKLKTKFSELQELYTYSLERNFLKLEQRTIELSTMTATERYIALRKRIPQIDNIISQFHIASHLGITPIQLSRIRKNLFSR